MAKAIFDDNSMFLELLGLTDSATDAAVTTAVVTGEIIDEDDASIWSGPLTYLGTAVTRNGVIYTDGNYRATIPEDTAYTTKTVANKTRYQRHWAKITADDGVNRDGLWREPLVVRYRDFEE
jgi:hypothetical protein